MQLIDIRNTTLRPITVNLSVYAPKQHDPEGNVRPGAGLKQRRLVTFVPSNVELEVEEGQEKHPKGITPIPIQAWKEAQKLHQVARMIKDGDLVEAN